MSVAVVLMPVALPFPVFVVACLFTLAAVLVVASEKTRRILGALLLAVILAAVVVPGVLHANEEDETGLILKADCERWWNEGDYYRYILHECYLYGGGR